LAKLYPNVAKVGGLQSPGCFIEGNFNELERWPGHSAVGGGGGGWQCFCDRLEVRQIICAYDGWLKIFSRKTAEALIYLCLLGDLASLRENLIVAPQCNDFKLIFDRRVKYQPSRQERFSFYNFSGIIDNDLIRTAQKSKSDIIS